MWEQYRKTAVVMQLFIVAATLTLRFALKLPWPAAAMAFIMMQAGALLGAWWGARVTRKVMDREEELPLKRRL